MENAYDFSGNILRGGSMLLYIVDGSLFLSAYGVVRIYATLLMGGHFSYLVRCLFLYN